MIRATLEAAAGVALCVVGCTQQDTLVYLWVPGLVLLAIAFHRYLARHVDPRPGYIIGKDQHHHDH